MEMGLNEEGRWMGGRSGRRAKGEGGSGEGVKNWKRAGNLKNLLLHQAFDVPQLS